MRQARQLIVAARRCLQDIVIGFGKYLDRVVGLLSARERRPQNRICRQTALAFPTVS